MDDLGRAPPALYTDSVVSVGLHPFVYDERPHVCVVVKATFDLTAPTATPTRPDPIVTEDVRRRPGAMSSLQRASELAPAKAACDLVLTGTLRRRSQRGDCGARLYVERAGRALLDKTVVATGDTTRFFNAEAGLAIPLIWELCLGGPRAAAPAATDNPVGTYAPILTALGPTGGGCFAPIAPEWPLRASLRASSPWAQFQIAPPDQRVPVLSGDERIVLEGFDDVTGRLETRLPGLVPCAWLVTRTGAISPIPLRLDTLAIEANDSPGRFRAHLVFRGVFALPKASHGADSDLVVTVQTALGRAPLPPSLKAVLAGAKRQAWCSSRSPTPDEVDSTLTPTPLSRMDRRNAGAPFPVAAPGPRLSAGLHVDSPRLTALPASDAGSETLPMRQRPAFVQAAPVPTYLLGRDGQGASPNAAEAPIDPLAPMIDEPSEAASQPADGPTYADEEEALAETLATAAATLRTRGLSESKVAEAVSALRKRLRAALDQPQSGPAK
ncbi:MAG: DUF2169 domain-containing protein [Polyangiaceae bacterium]